MRIVLDTDIGGDFDDANALALLLASPEADLIAVTTVGAGASARQRAQVARTMLDAVGRGGVPVFSGFDQPQQNNSVLSALVPQHCLNAWTPEMAEAHVHDWPKVVLVGFGGVTGIALATAATIASGGTALSVGLSIGAGVLQAGAAGRRQASPG
jgi:inosine-uridine nucleoside N-ribohydrolase